MTTWTQLNTSTVLNVQTPELHKRSSALLGLKMTFRGLLSLVVIVLVGIAALRSEANLLLLLFGISIGVLAFSAIAPFLMVRSIDVDRIVADTVMAGRPFEIIYVLRSRRRWLRCWSLVISETPASGQIAPFPRGFVPVLEAGKEQRIELLGHCPHRGRVTLTGIRVLSRFPFGLFSCQVTLKAQARLVVYPFVGRFRRNPWEDDRRYARSSGLSPARREAGHDEYYGLREYREGDNLRWVHWRRSARTGQLVIREMIPVRSTQLIVLVDPWPWLGGDSADMGPHGWDASLDADAERVISVSAMAVCDGLEKGHRVGLICRSALPVVIAPASGRPHRQRLLHELALLKPGACEQLDVLMSRIRWSGGWSGQCLLSTTRPGRGHETVAKFLGSRANTVLIISPQSETFDALVDLSTNPALDREKR